MGKENSKEKDVNIKNSDEKPKKLKRFGTITRRKGRNRAKTELPPIQPETLEDELDQTIQVTRKRSQSLPLAQLTPEQLNAKIQEMLGFYERRSSENIRNYYKVSFDNEVGSGGAAIVYKGRKWKPDEDPRTADTKWGEEDEKNEIFAIKRIKKNSAFNKAAASTHLVEREVEIMAKWMVIAKLDTSKRNAEIVYLEDYFRTEEEVYLVLEYVPGGELFDHLVRRGQYTEIEAAKIIKQVLSACAYMHQSGIAHRDLKPENILIFNAETLSVKVADFGLSKSFEQETLATACGTPDYVAPEVISGQKYTDLCDIWSVGVITFILLSGTFPFYSEDQGELLNKIWDIDYKFAGQQWKSISDTAKDFIQKIFVRSDTRPSAEECLKHNWFTETQLVESRNERKLRGHIESTMLFEFTAEGKKVSKETSKNSV